MFPRNKPTCFTQVFNFAIHSAACMPDPHSLPVYLVELKDPFLATCERSDVTRYLENALALVEQHFIDYREPIEAQVTVDPKSGELAGILFFNAAAETIAVVQPYYLNRDTLECDNPDILRLATEPPGKLEKAINKIFKR